MKKLRDESGQVIVLVLMSMGLMLGFMALSIDVGLLFRAKRNVQIAADAAAMAGAMDLLYNNTPATAKTAGKAASAANGITDGSGGAGVTINTPPTYGPNAGQGGYVEAIVKQPNTTLFMGYLGGISSVGVTARAVAGTPSASNACIWIMNPTTSDAFHLQGSGSVTAPNCGVYVNSNSSSAAKFTGNPSYTGPGFAVNGSASGHTTNIQNFSQNVAPESPPMGTSLTGPVPPGGCSVTSALTSVTTANQAGVQGSSSIPVVCFSKAVTLNTGVSLPGAANGVVYVFENGVTIPTGAIVNMGSATYTPPSGSATEGTYSNTQGAVMDLYGGTLSQGSGQSYLSIYAPTAGTYNAIAMMQPSSNTTTPLQVQFGSNNEYLDGIIYAPGVEVYLQDNGGGVTTSGVIANTMYIKSSSLNVPGYSAANQGTTPFRVLTMVE